jgi:hypothetical protein
MGGLPIEWKSSSQPMYTAELGWGYRWEEVAGRANARAST